MPREKIKYVTPTAIAKTWGVTRQQVAKWLKAERIPGARKLTSELGKTEWAIPADATKPTAEKPGRKKLSENLSQSD